MEPQSSLDDRGASLFERRSLPSNLRAATQLHSAACDSTAQTAARVRRINQTSQHFLQAKTRKKQRTLI
jgi:hypothetical protein